MKKLTLFVFFLFFFFNAFAQSWFENNPEWYWGQNSVFLYPYRMTTKTYIDGDTIIDNRSYKVLKNLWQQIDKSIPDTTYSENLHGYFYEEDQKVYKRNDEGDDILLFDGNLEIGDSLFYNSCSGMYLVYSGSSFQNISGEEIQVQSFNAYPISEDVIYNFPILVYEGIGIPTLDVMFGSYAGLNPKTMLACLYFGYPYYFYCYKNDSIEYSLSGPCEFPGEITTNLASDQSDKKIEVYPNPFTNEIRLKSIGVEGELSVKITKIDGTIVKEFLNIDSHILDVSSLNQGMYFLTIYSKGKFIGVEKIIKSVY